MRHPRLENAASPSLRPRRRPIRARTLCGLSTLLVVAALGCDDSPSSPASGLLLVTPLTLDWNGKDYDLPFDSRGTWYARANLRALWKFRIEARPADPNDPRWRGPAEPPLYTTQFSSQDRILFAWNTGMVNANCYAFARGDTCTASVVLTPALAPGEEPKAVCKFVIGG